MDIQAALSEAERALPKSIKARIVKLLYGETPTKQDFLCIGPIPREHHIAATGIAGVTHGSIFTGDQQCKGMLPCIFIALSKVDEGMLGQALQAVNNLLPARPAGLPTGAPASAVTNG